METAIPNIDRAARDCIETWVEAYRAVFDSRGLRPDFLKDGAFEAEPWKRLLEENRPGRRPIRAPIYVAQGEEDDDRAALDHRRFRGRPLPHRRDVSATRRCRAWITCARAGRAPRARSSGCATASTATARADDLPAVSSPEARAQGRGVGR